MRSLLLLAVRYHVLLIFLFLEIFSLVLVFNYNSFQRSTILNSTQQVVGSVQETSNNVVSFFQLGDENAKLADENARLRDSIKLLMAQITVNEDDLTRISLQKATKTQLIAAEIINSSYRKRNNLFTINKGFDDFVGKHQGVITNKGVVGIIKNVSRNYAAGLSVLHSETSVSAVIEGYNEVGALQWDFTDPSLAKLNYIPRHVHAQKGQQVNVSHLSYTFPEGTPIGEIVDVQLDQGAAYLDITVKLYEDLKNVKYVYVVKNKGVEEKVELEEKVEN